jgi:CBS domain-containing protein
VTIVRNSTHYESRVVEVRPGDTVRKIVEEMSFYAVGCVVVVDGRSRPAGVVTDRDLLSRVICARRDPDKTLAEDVMTADPVVGSTEEPIERLLEKMKTAGVRRLPIVREEKVVGLVSIDDIVAEIARELGDVRAGLRGAVLGARRTSQRRRRREEAAATIEEFRTRVARLGANSLDRIQRGIDAMRRRLGGSS